MDWRKAITRVVITTLAAPADAWLVQYVDQVYVWFAYLASVLYLSCRLFRPVQERPGKENFKAAKLPAVPISVLSGFLGIGPGFLLMPALIIVGFNTKTAAGINAFAVCPPSFSSLIPHIGTARWDPTLTVTLLIVGAVGSFIGARLSRLYVPGGRLKQLFGVLIAIMTAYKIYNHFA